MAYSLLLALIVLLLQQRQPVDAGAIEGSLLEVDQLLTQLDSFYQESIQKVFYDTKRDAESAQDYSLLELAAEMADCMVVLHAAERRSLFLAKDIIKRYFIDHTDNLNEVVLENKYAIDLLLNRLMQAAIEDSLWATEDRRRKIYLLWAYYHDSASIQRTTMEFLKAVAIAKAKEKQAAINTESSFQRYDDETSKLLTAHQRAIVMPAIDDLIEEAKERADQPLVQQSQPLNEENLVRRYISPDLLNDIRSALNSTIGQVQVLDQERIDRVNLSVIEKDLTRESSE